MVCLATASAAKFPQACAAAGFGAPSHPRLESLKSNPRNIKGTFQRGEDWTAKLKSIIQSIWEADWAFLLVTQLLREKYTHWGFWSVPTANEATFNHLPLTLRMKVSNHGSGDNQTLSVEPLCSSHIALVRSEQGGTNYHTHRNPQRPRHRPDQPLSHPRPREFFIPWLIPSVKKTLEEGTNYLAAPNQRGNDAFAWD